MTPDFQIAAEFDDFVNVAPAVPEDVTEAHLSITVPGDILTLNREPGRSKLVSTPSETVFGPVAGLADWFIENWGPIQWEMQTPFTKSEGVDATTAAKSKVLEKLREIVEDWQPWDLSLDVKHYVEELEDDFYTEVEARADWDHRHLLGHGCSNLALPRIFILPEMRNVVLLIEGLGREVRGSALFLSPDKNPRRRTFHVVSRDAFISETEQFINQTIARATSSGRFPKWAEWLDGRWKKAKKEAKEPVQQLRWMVGEVSAQRILKLDQSRPDIADPLRKLLLDCPIVTNATELTPIERLVNDYVLNGKHVKTTEAEFDWHRFARSAVNLDEPDFQQGYRLARLARKRLGIGDRPIRKTSEVLGRFGIAIGEECDSSMFRVAVCGSKSGQPCIIPSARDARMKTTTGYRFGVMAGLGRLLWEGRRVQSQPIVGAQGDYSVFTDGRRANAFAAELLLPGAMIQGMDPRSPEFFDVVEGYGISRTAAGWHLHNANSGEYGQS